MTKENELNNPVFSPIAMWLIAATFFIYQFVARSAFPTVLTDQYMQFFNLDAQGVGTLPGCYYFVYTLVQIPVGILVDKFSIRLICTSATLTCAIGVLIFVATSNFYVACFGEMLIGLGAAFAFISTLKIIIFWFPPQKNAMMTSLTMSIGALGPVVAGPSVACIVNHFAWRSVIFVFGILGLLLAVLVWIILRDKKGAHHADDDPNKIGLLESLKIIVTSPQAIIIALFTMMFYAPLSSVGDLWGIAFIKRLYGCSSETAAFANNMIYIGFVLGCPFFAHLSNVMDSFKKPMLIGIILCTLSFGAAIFVQVPIFAMFVLFFFIGFACGAMLGFSLASFLFPQSISGTVSSFVNMASMISGVVLMPLIGHIMDLSWDGEMEEGIKVYHVNDFKTGFLSVFAALVLGVVFALFLEDRSPKHSKSK